MNNDYYLRVYYEDTDTGGVVYHSMYLNYCERARSEIFFRNGISPIDNKYHFVVKNIDAKFTKPAKLGDELKVETLVFDIKKASVKLIQRIYFKEDSRLQLFEMAIELVCLHDNKISKIPVIFKNLFEKFNQNEKNKCSNIISKGLRTVFYLFNP